MICKYCHEKNHYIDNCPIIICKICKDIGHPQWLCNKKQVSSSHERKSDKKIKKNIIPQEPPLKQELHISDKNINHYIKTYDDLWSNYQ